MKQRRTAIISSKQDKKKQHSAVSQSTLFDMRKVVYAEKLDWWAWLRSTHLVSLLSVRGPSVLPEQGVESVTEKDPQVETGILLFIKV